MLQPHHPVGQGLGEEGQGSPHLAGPPPQQDFCHRTPANPSCWWATGRVHGPLILSRTPGASVDLTQLSPLTLLGSSLLKTEPSRILTQGVYRNKRLEEGLAVLTAQTWSQRLSLASARCPSPQASGSVCSPAHFGRHGAPGLAFRQWHQSHQ